jgi:hypothetical protein
MVRVEKGEELGSVGHFDWAIEEFEEAKKTAVNSPKINLALARHYRMKGDNCECVSRSREKLPGLLADVSRRDGTRGVGHFLSINELERH